MIVKHNVIFDRLDDVLGNYQEGIAREEDVIHVARAVNEYIIKNTILEDGETSALDKFLGIES